MGDLRQRLVDLSLPLAEDLPCSWPGNVPYQHKLFDWFVSGQGETGPLISHGRFQTRWLMLGEHTGTHFDAPTHRIPPPGSGLPDAGPSGEISTDRVPLEQLTGPAVVVDVRPFLEEAPPGVSPRVGGDAFEAFEAAHGRIEEGEVVLMRTDWDSRYVAGPAGNAYAVDCVAGRQPGWPAPTPQAVAFLLSRGVSCLGVDTPSVGALDDDHPAHIAGLAEGMVYVEGLTRLAELPVRGATFLFLPLPITGGTGAPGRAVALVDRA